MNRERKNQSARTTNPILRSVNPQSLFSAERIFLYVSLISLLLVGCSNPVKKEYSAGVTNVIIVAIDALRANHLGFMEYFRDTSPFLDELANRSVVFDNAFTPK